MVFLISYDLRGNWRPPSHYARLGHEIESISGTYCELQRSEWLIEAESSERAIAERIAPLTLAGDRILVTRIYPTWAGYSLTKEQVAWLQQRNFGSLIDSIAPFLPSPFAALTKLGR